MGMYRKKPVVIEARQVPVLPGTILSDELAGFEAPVRELAEWCGGEVPFFIANQIKIATLEGDMIARGGDWIIKGVNGEFYPCKPDIFEQTYEAVEAEVMV